MKVWYEEGNRVQFFIHWKIKKIEPQHIDYKEGNTEQHVHSRKTQHHEGSRT